jgi:uncharacterized damage-inducible protein DinB
MNDPLAEPRLLLAYGDEMNRRLLDASLPLSDAQLDAAYDIGPATLRKTLVHIVVGEEAWLSRWKGVVETRWRSFATPPTVGEIRVIADAVWAEREAFFATLDEAKLSTPQPYRDSSGSIFEATLRDQIWQGIVHSTHHRAQAVHLLNRASGTFVEVDFMYWRRQPA